MLREIGLKIPAHPPRFLTQAMMDDAKLRVTMGCLDDASCPVRLKTLKVTDWGLPDPAELDEAGFRKVRDEWRDRVAGLNQELKLLDRQLPGERTLVASVGPKSLGSGTVEGSNGSRPT
jgi:protein-tyrosine-phosphatase